MEETLKYLERIEDHRQEKKVRHRLSDIIGLAFFALLANANEWTEIEAFGKEHESFLRQYLYLEYGIPSHDTIQRVFGMVSPEYLQEFHQLWNEALNGEDGEKIKKILAIDGKTQRGNGRKNQKANHIVSAVDENGFSVGERRVDEKSNEIKAIPELLKSLNIKGKIITIDAMGTQKEIAKEIRRRRGDYVLAVKKNQGSLYEGIEEYFGDEELLKGCQYAKTLEKARGGIEKREYWQTSDIGWFSGKKEWRGLKTIGMTRNTILKEGKETIETRYFISSLPLEVKELARAIRKHWMVESYHWCLDCVFREDANQTQEKEAAYNLNIMRKLALNVLRIYETREKKTSLKLKRYSICTNPEKHLERILSL